LLDFNKKTSSGSLEVFFYMKITTMVSFQSRSRNSKALSLQSWWM